MPVCHVGTLSETDLDAVMVIERQSFKRIWQRSSFLGELACDNAYSYAVRCDVQDNPAQIIAYACFRVVADEMHLLKLAVAPQWRRRGIASWLLDKCFTAAIEKGAKVAFLEVRPSNKSAISLYQNSGFDLIGKRPHYYSETREDALILRKKL